MTHSKSLRAPTIVAGAGIVAALLVALAWLVWQARTPPTLSAGTLLQPPRAVPDFALLDHEGQPFARSRLLGQWSLLFFGFASCPDLCPTTLVTLASVEQSLNDLPAELRPHIVFVSVDSKRDAPERLREYVRHFGQRVVGVTGAQSDLEAFAASFGAPAALRMQADGSYNVEHSAAVFVVNPQAQWSALFGGPHHAAALADDLRLIIKAQQ